MKTTARLIVLLLLGSWALSPAARQGDGTVRHITQDEFLELVLDFDSLGNIVYKSDRPALVDFYADWCGPCKKLSPILAELAREHGEVDFYKVNVDNAPELAAAVGAQSIPLVVMFARGRRPDGFVGLHPKEDIERFINAFTASLDESTP